MKTRNYCCLVTLLLVICISHATQAQVQQDTTWHIQTKDGNEFFGKLITRTTETIVLKTDKLGEVTIQQQDISKMEVVSASKLINGKYWLDNPQAARYFWSPNGYGLKKGEAYYQNIWVLFNQVSVGVTDRFSVGLGIVPLFMFGGAPTPLWITPKFSIPISENRFNVGVGALMGTVTGVSKSGFGIAYGIGTIGSRDRNVSLGVGYGYAGGQWGNTPTITLSSMIRMSSKTYFLTENYFIPIGNNYYFMGSAGVRVIMGHVGMDFGFVVPKSSGNSFVAIPWLGVTVPFGKIPIRK